LRHVNHSAVEHGSVMVWDDGHLIAANEHNLPSQNGGDLAAPTPTEIIRLDQGGAMEENLKSCG